MHNFGIVELLKRKMIEADKDAHNSNPRRFDTSEIWPVIDALEKEIELLQEILNRRNDAPKVEPYKFELQADNNKLLASNVELIDTRHKHEQRIAELEREIAQHKNMNSLLNDAVTALDLKNAELVHAMATIKSQPAPKVEPVLTLKTQVELVDALNRINAQLAELTQKVGNK